MNRDVILLPHLLIILFLAIPIWIIAFRLPRKQGFPRRFIISGALVVVIACAAKLALTGPGDLTEGNIVGKLAMFSIIMASFVPAIRHCCRATLSSALFCVTAGYTMQNLTSELGQVVLMLLASNPSAPLDAIVSPAMVCSLVIVYGACYLILIRKVSGPELAELDNRPMFFMFAVVSIAIIGLDIVIKDVTEASTLQQALALRLAHSFICIFVLFSEYEILYMSKMRAEKIATEHLLAKSKQQYELSRANIEAINVKCHDLRHQIRSISTAGANSTQAALDDLANDVDVYDRFAETGCDALDVVLTEKNLICSEEGIELSCIADGSGLSRMTPADVYSLFGNALENAIEAARVIDDPNKRTVSLKVRHRGAMTSIRVDNYVKDPGSVRFVDGLPRTSKGDQLSHGFGMRSMQLVAERYGGSIAARMENGIFKLSILIPE